MTIPETPPPEKEQSAIPPGRVTIILECEGAGPPLVCRARKLAKSALRAWGLRALSIDLHGGGGGEKIGGGE